MTTSGSTNWTRTGHEIVRSALRSIGVIASGETPTSDEYADGLEALNLLIKAWQAEDIGLWLIDTGSFTLTSGKTSYSLGPGGDYAIVRPLEIVETRFYNSTAVTYTPLTKLASSEFYGISNRTLPGTPTEFYYVPTLSLGYLYLWPIWNGTAADQIIFRYKTEVEDFDTNKDNPDFPKEWFRALRFNLAIELAPEYGKEVGATLAALAIDSKSSVAMWDREHVSTFIGRDRR